MRFTLDDKQLEKFVNWDAAHRLKCPYSPTSGGDCGAIGGRLTFSFTPTGIGVVTKVDCTCGEVLDLSDYENW
jgi:hypothetical protein